MTVYSELGAGSHKKGRPSRRLSLMRRGCALRLHSARVPLVRRGKAVGRPRLAASLDRGVRCHPYRSLRSAILSSIHLQHMRSAQASPDPSKDAMMPKVGGCAVRRPLPKRNVRALPTVMEVRLP